MKVLYVPLKLFQGDTTITQSDLNKAISEGLIDEGTLLPALTEAQVQEMQERKLEMLKEEKKYEIEELVKKNSSLELIGKHVKAPIVSILTTSKKQLEGLLLSLDKDTREFIIHKSFGERIPLGKL